MASQLFWAVYARVYDQLWDNELFAEIGRQVAATLPPGAPALDVGAGTGIVAGHLVAAGHKVTGCEPNKSMADRFARRLTTVDLLRLSLEDLAPGLAEHVVAINFLHMASDPNAALARLRSVCRPGGSVVVVTADPRAGLLKVASAQRCAGVSRWRAARFVIWHMLLGPLTIACGMSAAQRLDCVEEIALRIHQSAGRCPPTTVAGVFRLWCFSASGKPRD